MSNLNKINELLILAEKKYKEINDARDKIRDEEYEKLGYPHGYDYEAYNKERDIVKKYYQEAYNLVNTKEEFLTILSHTQFSGLDLEKELSQKEICELENKITSEQLELLFDILIKANSSKDFTSIANSAIIFLSSVYKRWFSTRIYELALAKAEFYSDFIFLRDSSDNALSSMSGYIEFEMFKAVESKSEKIYRNNRFSEESDYSEFEVILNIIENTNNSFAVHILKKELSKEPTFDKLLVIAEIFLMKINNNEKSIKLFEKGINMFDLNKAKNKLKLKIFAEKIVYFHSTRHKKIAVKIYNIIKTKLEELNCIDFNKLLDDISEESLEFNKI